MFIAYKLIMSWWLMITTKGRLLQDFCLSFREGEIRVSWARLEEGEDVAVLIDRLNNKARLYVPLDAAQLLASRHQYELILPHMAERETLVAHIERLLSVFRWV
jgi:hypothetical protein